jgi:hypothetical protein
MEMQSKMIIKGETAIHGLRGDGMNTGALWEKFEKRYAKKPFEKVGEDAYEIRTYYDNENTAMENWLTANCKFRKTYTLGGETIEKCSGEVFTFNTPPLEMLSDYIALFDEFYPKKSSHKYT